MNMKYFWLLFFFIVSCLQPVTTHAKIHNPRSSNKDVIDFIHIEKKKRQMTVFYREQSPKTYRVALGFSPLGHKESKGDGKTPEGTYTITYKNPESRFHRSLKLSYPGPEDWKRANRKGVHPGSDIMIHGLSERFAGVGKWHAIKDWTLGCIAVTNDEIEEIYRIAEVGTKVKISP